MGVAWMRTLGDTSKPSLMCDGKLGRLVLKQHKIYRHIRFNPWQKCACVTRVRRAAGYFAGSPKRSGSRGSADKKGKGSKSPSGKEKKSAKGSRGKPFNSCPMYQAHYNYYTLWLAADAVQILMIELLSLIVMAAGGSPKSPKRSKSGGKKAKTPEPEPEPEPEQPPGTPPPQPGSDEWVYVDQPLDEVCMWF